MNANWRSTRSPNVVYINTDLHRATLLDENVSYPLDELGQGRNSTTPVPAFSMYAGTPTEEDVDSHNYRARALRRMLAAAVGAWLAFGLLVWLAHSASNGG